MAGRLSVPPRTGRLGTKRSVAAVKTGGSARRAVERGDIIPHRRSAALFRARSRSEAIGAALGRPVGTGSTEAMLEQWVAQGSESGAGAAV